MTTFKILINRILTALIAATMLAPAHFLPVHAEVPTIDGASISVTQKWARNDGGNTDVTYCLMPVGALTDSGVATNTTDALESGAVSYTVTVENGHTIGNRYVLSGNDQAHISFSWTKAGVYIFDLEPVNGEVVFDDGHGYHYDHTTYRIRLYAKNNGEAFFTVQNLSKSEDEDAGKVGEIIYNHQYVGQKKDDGGTSDGNFDRSGDNSDFSNKTTNSDINNSDAGKTDQNNSGTGNTETINNADKNETATNQNTSRHVYNTGDSSNFGLYATIAIIAFFAIVIWIVWKNSRYDK